MYQRNRRFIDYLNDFQINIEYIDYDKIAQMIHFRRDLFVKFKEKLIVFSKMNLKNFIVKCQYMNNQIHFLN